MKKHTSKHKSWMFRRIRRFLRANEAVSALEYALLVGVIATTITGALVLFGDTIETSIDAMQDEVTEAVGEVED